MAPPAKFNDQALKQYLDMGFSQVEIARLFRVTEGAISHRVAKLEKPAAVRQAQVVAAAQHSVFDTRAALEEHYRGCLALLQDPENDPVQVHALLLRYVESGLRTLEKWYELTEQQQFQEDVLRILDECSPGARKRFFECVEQRRAVRAAFAEGRRALPE